jgi:glutathione S-transferase
MHFPWLQPLHWLKAPPLMEQANVVAWIERIAERPAVQRGMKVPES